MDQRVDSQVHLETTDSDVLTFRIMTVRADETLDKLTFGNLKIIQSKKGYRFSIDPVLLCGFVGELSGLRVADLGAGNGIIPFILSARNEARELVGVERQPDMVDRARRSTQINRLNDTVRIIQSDIRDLPAKEVVSGSFDVITTNPPYYPPANGRVAPNVERGAARHEIAGGLEDFLEAASLLLKKEGRFYIVYPAERMAELLAGMRVATLEPKRLRLVCSRVGEDAKLVLVEGQKNGSSGMIVEQPLVVYDGAGRQYSAEVLSMYGLDGDSRR